MMNKMVLLIFLIPIFAFPANTLPLGEPYALLEKGEFQLRFNYGQVPNIHFEYVYRENFPQHIYDVELSYGLLRDLLIAVSVIGNCDFLNSVEGYYQNIHFYDPLNNYPRRVFAGGKLSGLWRIHNGRKLLPNIDVLFSMFIPFTPVNFELQEQVLGYLIQSPFLNLSWEYSLGNFALRRVIVGYRFNGFLQGFATLAGVEMTLSSSRKIRPGFGNPYLILFFGEIFQVGVNYYDYYYYDIVDAGLTVRINDVALSMGVSATRIKDDLEEYPIFPFIQIIYSWM